MSRGRTHRTDITQKLIVEAVRKHSRATVEVLSQVGNGCPDIMVGRRFNGGLRNDLWEIKSPGGKLSPEQEKWHKAWMGQVCVVSTIWEAVSMAGVDQRDAAEIDRKYRTRYEEVWGGDKGWEKASRIAG